jgi:hypothetical protein
MRGAVSPCCEVQDRGGTTLLEWRKRPFSKPLPSERELIQKEKTCRNNAVLVA